MPRSKIPLSNNRDLRRFENKSRSLLRQELVTGERANNKESHTRINHRDLHRYPTLETHCAHPETLERKAYAQEVEEQAKALNNQEVEEIQEQSSELLLPEPVFGKPEQFVKFSGPDYYASLTSTKKLQKAFAKFIESYNQNGEFTPEQRIELDRLYREGYIRPLTMKQSKKQTKALEGLKKGLRHGRLGSGAKLAYHLCGGEEKNPVPQTIVDFLKAREFKLPSSMTINRSRKAEKELNAGEKYKRDIANGKLSRLVPQVIRSKRGHRTVQLSRRFTEKDDIPKGKELGDEKLIRRTLQHPGRRASIAEFENKAVIRKEREPELGGADTPRTTEVSQPKPNQVYSNVISSLGWSITDEIKQSDNELTIQDLLLGFQRKLQEITGGHGQYHCSILKYFIGLDNSVDLKKTADREIRFRQMISGKIPLIKRQEEFLRAAHQLGYFKAEAKIGRALIHHEPTRGGINGYSSDLTKGLFSLNHQEKSPVPPPRRIDISKLNRRKHDFSAQECLLEFSQRIASLREKSGTTVSENNKELELVKLVKGQLSNLAGRQVKLKDTNGEMLFEGSASLICVNREGDNIVLRVNLSNDSDFVIPFQRANIKIYVQKENSLSYGLLGTLGDQKLQIKPLEPSLNPDYQPETFNDEVKQFSKETPTPRVGEEYDLGTIRVGRQSYSEVELLLPKLGSADFLLVDSRSGVELFKAPADEISLEFIQENGSIVFRDSRHEDDRLSFTLRGLGTYSMVSSVFPEEVPST